MLGACANDAVQRVQDLIVSLVVTGREACKQREIALIAGAGKDEVRVYLRCDLSQVRRFLCFVLAVNRRPLDAMPCNGQALVQSASCSANASEATEPQVRMTTSWTAHPLG